MTAKVGHLRTRGMKIQDYGMVMRTRKHLHFLLNIFISGKPLAGPGLMAHKDNWDGQYQLIGAQKIWKTPFFFFTSVLDNHYSAIYMIDLHIMLAGSECLFFGQWKNKVWYQFSNTGKYLLKISEYIKQDKNGFHPFFHHLILFSVQFLEV